MKKNFSTLSSPPPRHISIQNNETAVSGVQTNPVGNAFSSYINFHVSENDHVIENDLVAILRFRGRLDQCFYGIAPWNLFWEGV